MYDKISPPSTLMLKQTAVTTTRTHCSMRTDYVPEPMWNKSQDKMR
jgi:hypothetical protein